MPDLLDGESFDSILSRDVSAAERMEALLQYQSVITFYEHFTAKFFSITHQEYEQIPAIVFSGLTIYQEIYQQYLKQQKSG